MQKIESFTYGNFYHVYNRGINGCDIFRENDNYSYFLKLYDQFLSPIGDTYAWVLMPNHFHLLVRVKEEGEILAATNPDRVSNPVRDDKTPPVRVGTPSQQMAHLFNSYAQAFNKRFNRHGSLFEKRFKRKRIHNHEYLRNVVLYIHNNPIHHHFCDHLLDYPWSSYLTCITVKPTRLKRDTVIGWFDDEANFKYMHNQKVEVEAIEKWLELA
jgi:REP element-mobilizing transposase RayT